MIVRKLIVGLLVIISISSVECGFFGNFSGFSGFSKKMAIVAKPFVWMKQAVVTQVHNYRFQEFQNCLSLNETKFDMYKFVSRADEAARFGALHKPWNLRKRVVEPLAYILPTSAQDVSKIVQCGVKSSVHLVPNSGGLSFESISWGGPDMVVVDFRNMRGIQTEETADGSVVVNVQPGALVGHIHAHLWKNGGHGLPMVNHLTAGMAGDATGGGQGPFSALYGLTVDRILSIEMVDAFGNLHTVGPNNPPDLWWGLRGMGPGFIGIVTQIKLKTFKASDLKLTYATFRYPLKRFVPTLEAFQKFHDWAEQNNPMISRTLFMTSARYNRNFPSLLKGITIQLLHIQDPVLQPNSAESFLTAIKSIFPKTDNTSITNPNYFEFVTTTGYAPIKYPEILDNGFPAYNLTAKMFRGQIPTEDELHSYMNLLSKGISYERYFKLKSMFMKRQISNPELLTLKSHVIDMPAHTLIQLTTETGAIRQHPRTENSYVHRNATFNLSVRYEGTKKKSAVQTGMTWIQEFWKAIQVLDSGETYQNYPDLDIEALERLGRNFRERKGKLVDVKRKWDPEEYFKTEVSIPIFLH